MSADLTGKRDVAIAVCDDEPAARELITHMTREILKRENVPCKIKVFDSGVALFDAIGAGADFQILLLDVMMANLDGMALAARLRSLGHQTAIIFISAYHEKALEGYEVSAARFIGKPINPDKMREALLYCVGAIEKDRTIILPTPAGAHRLTVKEIYYAETWGRGIRVTYRGGRIESSTAISRLQEMLADPRFVFCHRAYLINMDHVRALRYGEADMADGSTVPVSKHRYAEIREKFTGVPPGGA